MKVSGPEPDPTRASGPAQDGKRSQLPARTDSGGATTEARLAVPRTRANPWRDHTPWRADERRFGASRPRSRDDARGCSGRRRTLEGNKAHGRIGRSTAGNGGGSLRTRRRSKALKSATPRYSSRARCSGNGHRFGEPDRAQLRAVTQVISQSVRSELPASRPEADPRSHGQAPGPDLDPGTRGSRVPA